MGKPSIFSKEYEKKMKKRRKNALAVSLVIILIVSVIAFKSINNPLNYTNIKKNIQAWIDNDTTSGTEQTVVKKENETTEPKAKEEPKKPVEESMDIPLASGNTVKAVCENDEKSGKIFKTLNNIDNGVSYDISSSGKQMIITDNNSVISLYNVDGTAKIISKDQYTSTKGDVFTKDATMKAQPAYLWNANPKFISEDKIVFITNRPYFGASASKKYLWITDIQSGEDKTLWEMAGNNIEIGEKEEKGVKVTIDNKVYYIDVNGNYVQ